MHSELVVERGIHGVLTIAFRIFTGQCTKAFDVVSLNLLLQIGCHSPEIPFVYPLGGERSGRHISSSEIHWVFCTKWLKDALVLIRCTVLPAAPGY